MPRIFISIFLFGVFAKCNNESEKTSSKAEISSTNEISKDSPCTFFNPDTSIANIMLRYPKSTIAVIGEKEKYYADEKYHYYSTMYRETLTLTPYPGDSEKSISLFQIEFSDKTNYGYKELNIDTFKTEKGIKLGMSKKQIIEKLGNCYVAKDSTNGYIELYYRLEYPNDSKTKLLERQNMPIYYASYKLWKDKLEKFEFGFEYP